MNIAIVGSGFSGAVIARELASAGFGSTIFESRDHVGGNCYTYIDNDTDVIVHKYGPHIFHTDNKMVWDYINQFANFIPYINRVKTTVNGTVYSLPVNLHTINQFYGESLSPNEAQQFISNVADSTIAEPQNFEEQALKFIGSGLYEAFFKGYTLKQWGLDPKRLPASILKRLPVRFNYNDNYFNHHYQAMPENGYTEIFEKLLDHPLITLKLNSEFDKHQAVDFDQVIYTGPLDAWFGFKFGRLGYRTLDFESEQHQGDYQGCAVMNYGDIGVPFTRISEHQHFSPWRETKGSLIFKEYSRECGEKDTPYYPIRLVDDKELLQTYVQAANQLSGVSFLGRLGTYRYLDMDQTIAEALNASKTLIEHLKSGSKVPSFFVDPLA